MVEIEKPKVTLVQGRPELKDTEDRGLSFSNCHLLSLPFLSLSQVHMLSWGNGLWLTVSLLLKQPEGWGAVHSQNTSKALV